MGSCGVQAAMEGKIRSRLVKCYTVADPSKLSKIDHFMEKYEGREMALFAQVCMHGSATFALLKAFDCYIYSVVSHLISAKGEVQENSRMPVLRTVY